jgi:hypothetical protein
VGELEELRELRELSMWGLLNQRAETVGRLFGEKAECTLGPAHGGRQRTPGWSAPV